MDKEPEPKFEDAKTLGELNIHMAYIRERIVLNNNERTQDLKDIKESLKEVAKNQITRSEFDDVKADVKTNSEAINSLLEFKNTLNGKLWGVGVMAGLVVGLINIIITSLIETK